MKVTRFGSRLEVYISARFVMVNGLLNSRRVVPPSFPILPPSSVLSCNRCGTNKMPPWFNIPTCDACLIFEIQVLRAINLANLADATEI